ncbi:TonB-dependent receptor [Pontibacter sp. SGAir0037]|uniref:SusC/RagA family TonB-linked outer membrane protein n=1 Tax=Pontibacter sp. SGAir0037 TaxID=2571030 RepID=UPI0010CCC5FC|nr:TonB-dependent receptor [Pontibacter sp. SGAir0037]QCR23338.1 SusC/RagA family TonB-linked outer membrane protein [Pontibacter sp. SGAir0037]
MRKLLLICFALLCVLHQHAYAQGKTVSGTVTDQATGQGLPGVSVLVKGTGTGVTTGANGTYTINVPANATTLVYRFLGYVSVEREIGNLTSINVTLGTDDKVLNEVVVTGYGTTNKQEFTGAAATVTGEAIKERPVQSFAQALTGQAAGVNIVQPNGLLNNPPVIRVRGVNSISLSSFPLVVVDGIPISTGGVSDNSASNNPLADINPADIESIDILKDAASTSIYGSRAAAGVLIITTKKGKQGQTRVNYDGWVGVSKATRLPDMLNAQEFMDYKNMARANANLAEGFLPSYNADGSMVDTDWLDLVYRNAVSHNHALSVSGGTDRTSYYFSAGVSDQEGFIKNNVFNRKTARLNINHKVTDWFSLRGNVTYSNSLNQAPNSGSLPGQAFSVAGLGRIALVMSPNVSPYNPDGSYNLSGNAIGAGANVGSVGYYNPVVLLDLDKMTSESNRIIANMGADFTLFKGLTFKTTYSYDLNNTEGKLFYNPLNGDGWVAAPATGGSSSNSNGRRENWNWVNTLQYQTTFAENHNFSLLVGTDAQEMTSDYWWATRSQLAIPTFNDYGATYGINSAGGSLGKRVYESYISSLNYNYANKYFLNANFRRDGNSALASEVRWGNFGGASIGWALSEEDFFKNASFANTVSNFKLKASWGKVGNGNIGDNYGSYTQYSDGLYATVPSLVYAQAGNNELTWETSNQTNIGFDLGLFNNRLTLEANYYNNDVDGLILAVPQAPSKGIPGNSILQNVGSMYNKGFEFAISGSPIDKGGFTWTTNFNITTVKNEVTALVGEDPILGATSSLETANITKVGYPVSSLYVVKTAGINPENGRRIFINKNGEQVQYLHGGGANAWTYLNGTQASAVSGADAQIAGNTIPKWYGGFTNNFSYRNIDLNILFTYSGGNYIYNGTQAGLRDQRIWNNHTDVLNYWSETNKDTNIPRPVFGDNVSNGSAFPIDANVQKGDFLRLQNILLGYRLPKSLFGKSGINSLRIYAQADNLFLLTGYTGSDPEISSNGNSNIASGIERNSVPQGRVMTVGLNLGF